MKEHYGLSKAQLNYLNGQDMPKSFNASKECDRMKKKADQAWSIFLPILKSKVVDQEFKDEIFSHNRFQIFLTELIRTNRVSPILQEQPKMKIARMMIQQGFVFFQTRYQPNQLIIDEMSKISSIMNMLDDIVDQELRNIELEDVLRMRLGQYYPPIIRRDQYYHARCLACYSYDLGVSNSEEEAITNIAHNEGCIYAKQSKDAEKNRLEELRTDFIQVFSPKK